MIDYIFMLQSPPFSLPQTKFGWYIGFSLSVCLSFCPSVCQCPLWKWFLPASPKAKADLGVQSLRPSVRPIILSSQLLWHYWSNYHETWYVDRTSYVVMHIGRKFWSPHFCGSYVPWNLENTINDLVIATPLKLLIHLSWNLVCR